MPNGRTHAAASALLAVGLFGVSLVSMDNLGTSGFMLPLGALSGILISPDLDIDDGNISDLIILNHLGRVPQFLWRVYWTPYAKLTPHRHWFSHSIFGTVFRVLYIYTLPLILLEVAYPGTFQKVTSPSALQWFFPWFIGLAFADFLHILMDIIVSAVKKIFRRF